MSQMPFYVSPEQLMKDRADFARKGIARGRSVVVLTYADGILFVAENHSRTLHKVSEIYDRIGFAAVGKYNEFENLRVAGVRYADLRGYSYDRTDVTARGLANAYAQTLGTVFTQESKPYEVEIVVAEVGRTPEGDQIYRLTYDGSVADERAYVAMGGAAEAIEEGLGAGWSEGMDLASALTLAVSQLAKDQAGGPDRVLGPDQLEVAVLDRHRPRRTFRRIVGAALANLLGDLVASARVDGGASDADATGSAKATEVHANPGDSPRQTATNPQTQRPNQDDAHHGDADDHDAADVHGTDS
ncbi:MAG TPA: proteasome subunit alpha [Phycicoccus sp.]|jgi:proteasome alpha subunit|nr:proteasome subunit alpha [Phycicoccus sp.]HQH06659.1 proteasome subunit alpha [Phycicoccus sp.]HQK31931.1 proteasome subunit alpha [Phycicoccus sp.]HRA44810.1 proteasome subunit alpha [Phycicoccus sp.]